MAVATDPLLDRLSATLKIVVAAAESGDWEQFDALATEFQALERVVTTIAPPRRDTAAFKRQVEEILALHERALALCKNRMTTIEPLVRALAVPPHDTTP